MPAPMPFMPAMPLPIATRASKMTGQTNSRTTDTRMEIRPVAIATKRLPEKNASQSGSWISLNLL